MKARSIGPLLGYACLLVACTKASDVANGAAGHAGAQSGTGGSAVAGSQGAAGAGAKGGAGGRGAGGRGAGAGGAAGGTGCPSGIAIPALCRMCADGSCGTASCSAGKFTGFVCPDDADGGAAGGAGSAGSGGGACNLACVIGTHCVVNPTPMCVPDASDAGVDAGSSGALHWVVSCGSPVCQGNGIYDSPNIPNCTTEQEGQSCMTEGQRCDGVAMCGATLLCATKPPQTCPISRARYKQEIHYLGDAERDQFHDQVTQMRLASYRYKSAPDVPQLGFMIDDVEPSVAVAGDHVNLYAYLSMAVAAIQVQDRQIKDLQRELERLRANDCQVPLRCD